jgi:hypothetical protein
VAYVSVGSQCLLEDHFLSQLSPSASSYPTPPAPPMRWTARGMMKWMGTAAPPAGAGPTAIWPSGPLQPAGHPRPSGPTYCITRNRSWLLSSSPVKIIMMCIWCTAVMWNVGNYLAVRPIGLMTHSKCWVDSQFRNHVIRCWVRTSPPPPSCRMGMGPPI